MVIESLWCIAGESCNGKSGDLRLTTGAAVNGAGGDVALAVGTGNTGAGGAVSLIAGETTDSTGAGGEVNIIAGQGGNMGDGGSLKISAGAAGGNAGDGGDITVDAGSSTAGTAGKVHLGPSSSVVNIGDPLGTSTVNMYGDLTVDQLTIGTGGTAIQKHISAVSSVYDPASLATGSQLSLDVTVNGAVVGDIVLAAFSEPLQGMLISANVKSAGVVQIVIVNPGSNMVVDLASGTFRISIWQYV